MTQVVDASVVLAGLTDQGGGGQWARDQLRHDVLIAPEVMPAEVTSGLRRLVSSGQVRPTAAQSALDFLRVLDVELYPFLPLHQRVWELRSNVTTYDAWYVALAETHSCALATLDRRLVAAAGPRCPFVTLPSR